MRRGRSRGSPLSRDGRGRVRAKRGSRVRVHAPSSTSTTLTRSLTRVSLSPSGRGEGEPCCPAPTTAFISASSQAQVQHQVLARWGSPEHDPSSSTTHSSFPAHRFGNSRDRHSAGARLQHRPQGHLSRPRSGPAARPSSHSTFGCARSSGRRAGPYGQARERRMAARQGAALSQYWLPGGGPRAHAGHLPFNRQRPWRGAQAKRRTAAVVVDHLMPAMARAESYGPAAEIEASY
jgi:cobaltochelatase CobN